MSRPRRARSANAEALTEAEWHFLFDAAKPAGTESGEWWTVVHDETTLRGEGALSHADLWRRYGPDVLAAWTAARPGTRPSLWWRYSAPEPQRRRLGGSGTLACECSAVTLTLSRGLPGPWSAIDAAKPPTFESEAAYLDWHGLLTLAERRRLTKADFEPVALAVVF